MENNDQSCHNIGFLIKLTIISAIGGFLFGYDTGIIGTANIYIYDDLGYHVTVVEESVVSIALLGAAFGSIAGGIWSDKYGRKATILISDVLFISGSISMAFRMFNIASTKNVS